MLKDPFYRQIKQALSGHLDPLVFERCMADLLRRDYPTLVPVSGGRDSGFDGLIADAEGTFPLICTTAEDVERNLDDSLEAIRKREWRVQRVALATSQALTPDRRLKLFDRADKAGFRRMQVFDQEALVDRLYHNNRWCKELLQLSGAPLALSAVPVTRRPLIDLDPVGRDDDLKWLQETKGDLVLSGEPGSGKTYLAYHLIRKKDWPALFLISDDFDGGAVANALRGLEPEIVIVDDAHYDLDRIRRLGHLRRDPGFDFRIVATTWKGGLDQVAETLGGKAQVRQLELLTRDEIVKVYRGIGVPEDEPYLRNMVNQAANKPGLAATIGSLWLQGQWREVIEGKILSQTLLTFFEEYVGKSARSLLAALSLGGDRGMRLEDVREFLQMSRTEFHRAAVGLASGGVLRELDKETWAVWPRELRYPLLRAVFFPDDTPPLGDYRVLLEKAPKLAKAVDTLVLARHHGANIPDDELRALVQRAGSREAWALFAALPGPHCCWVLAHYSGDLADVAREGLGSDPDALVPALLERATTETSNPDSQPDHPMRILADWAQEAQELKRFSPEKRRWVLARASRDFMLKGGPQVIGVWGLSLALSPVLRGKRIDPGMGRTLTLQWGFWRAVEQLESIWEEVRFAITSLETASWPYMRQALLEWLNPEYAAVDVEIPEAAKAEYLALATKVMRDLVPLVAGRPGLTAALALLAQNAGVELEMERDRNFELLYPGPPFEVLSDLDAAFGHQIEAIKQLAADWEARNPKEVASQLAYYEEQARPLIRTWPNWSQELCRQLAARVKDIESWLEAFLAQGTSAVLASPFLSRIVEARPTGWEAKLERALDQEGLAPVALEQILGLVDPPEALLELALERLPGFPTQLVEVLCLRGEAPIPTLQRLLGHPDPAISLAAAVGEWNATPQGSVRGVVACQWRHVILSTGIDEDPETEADRSRHFWLGTILSKDSELAFGWLQARLENEERPFDIDEDGPFARAISTLSQEQRLALVARLANGRVPVGFARNLIGKDPVVYRELLASPALQQGHLEPLREEPNQEWLELALTALQAGYEAPRIVRMAGEWSWYADHWQKLDAAFALLEADPREGAQLIAREGRGLAQERIHAALAAERQEAIQGI